MPLAHRHGPCSPVQSEEEEPFEETLRRDLAHTKKYITASASSRRSRQMHKDTGLAALDSSVGSNQYVVTVGLGTPAVPQTLVLNTANELTWIQCKPCNDTGSSGGNSKCYPQKDQLFDGSRSSTYAPVTCDSQACRTLASGIDGNGCDADSSECAYKISYGYGSNTTGVYSTDVLTLSPGAVIKSFRLGCGHDQQGPFGRYAGILGLGRLPESLAFQTSPEHRGVFSHCLPPTGSTTGFLALGAPANTSGFAFTPLLTIDELPWFYQLMLTGISVGGEELDIPPAVFREGVITASGTVLTALQETA
jgi:hypothetical protein